jgi:hypothetical protein
MPRHAGALQDGELVTGIVIHIMEIHDTSIVVILSWEERLREVSEVDVGKRVIMSVPATETEIESTNRSIMIVHHDNLARITSKTR